MSTTASTNVGPDGKQFPWGDIICAHTIGDYIIVEYHERQPNNVTDDEWAARADSDGEHICFGINTRADTYFIRMIGGIQ